MKYCVGLGRHDPCMLKKNKNNHFLFKYKLLRNNKKETDSMRTKWWLLKGRGVGKIGELDKGDEELQTCSYKISHGGEK